MRSAWRSRDGHRSDETAADPDRQDYRALLQRTGTSPTEDPSDDQEDADIDDVIDTPEPGSPNPKPNTNPNTEAVAE